MTKHYQRQIDLLKQKILTVGSMVEASLSKAISSLTHRDGKLAQEVVDADLQIDHMEVEVEEECLKTLALYQPVAVDLRFIVTVLKINNDLERMGDKAKNIARRVLTLVGHEWIELPIGLRDMAAKVQSMVKRSLDALVERDVAAAHDIRLSDQEINALRSRIRHALPDRIRRDPEHTDGLLLLDEIARQLERMADMATNIAEDVIYMVEGEIVRHTSES